MQPMRPHRLFMGSDDLYGHLQLADAHDGVHVRRAAVLAIDEIERSLQRHAQRAVPPPPRECCRVEHASNHLPPVVAPSLLCHLRRCGGLDRMSAGVTIGGVLARRVRGDVTRRPLHREAAAHEGEGTLL